MHLAIDIGNSDVVLGFFKGTDCILTFRTPAADEKTVENYALEIESYFMEKSFDASELKQVTISSVVPLITPKFENIAEHIFQIRPLVLKEDIYDLLPIEIVNKHEIGSDLVANSVASFERMKAACIIIDFGTALTFTTLDEKGKILGVAIAPGLKTAFESLFINTAKLPDVPFEVPHSVLGRDTVHAIQSGIFYGYEGMVRGIVEKIREEEPKDYKIIGTGGLVEKLKDLSGLFDHVDPMLTLNGIRRIGEITAIK
jgi:type III pantothenate kinase